MRSLVSGSLSMLVAASAWAQTAPVPREFPADATSPPAAALTERLGGKVYAVRLADGSSWRWEFKSSGHFFVDTSTGGRAAGDWRGEDGKLCARLRGNAMTCNEVRQLGDAIYLKRDSGEVIALKPQ